MLYRYQLSESLLEQKYMQEPDDGDLLAREAAEDEDMLAQEAEDDNMPALADVPDNEDDDDDVALAWQPATAEDVSYMDRDALGNYIKEGFAHLGSEGLCFYLDYPSLSENTLAPAGIRIDQKDHLPWKTMPTKLALDWKVRISNWPVTIRFPGDPENTTRRGLSSLLLPERRELALALSGLQFQRLDTGNADGDESPFFF